MELYKIQDLERLTGIKAHTIRIWESRYKLLKPQRTDTNIRLYSDKQLHKLLNISTLIRKGYKISELAALNSKKLAELVNNFAISAGNENLSSLHYDLIDALIHATINYSEAEFEAVFASACKHLGLQRSMQDVIYPYLIKLGLLWNTEQIATVQEHFATHLIRRKLMTAIDSLPMQGKKGKKFLLYLPNNEWHDIPLLYANYLIRNTGWETIYLGQSLPQQQLLQVIKQTRPTHLLSFIISYRSAEDIISATSSLRHSFPSLIQLLGGAPEHIQNLILPKGTHLLLSPKDLSMHI